MKREERTGITLIEVMIATLILFTAMFFIFQIISTAYTHMTNMKYMAQLASLAQSKTEDIIYKNTATVTGGYLAYPGYPEFQYQITLEDLYLDQFFPGYKAQKVNVKVKGPMGRKNIPEHDLQVTTMIMNEIQDISTTSDRQWGAGMSAEGLTDE